MAKYKIVRPKASGEFPVEPKVKNAASGAAVTVGFVLYLVGFAYPEGDVPQAVAAFVAFVVTGIVSFVSGYVTDHVERWRD